jgi:hypothetical protein
MSENTTPKPEVQQYVVGIYGLTTAQHVQDVLLRIRNWHHVTQVVVMCYRPEMNSIAIGCNPEDFLNLVGYALPLMFMEGHISAFKVDAVYSPKRCVQIRCYNRDTNGRRYRWFKYKHGEKQVMYIDPDPELQPAEALQAA